MSSLEHANHNFALYKELINLKKYDDWVITVAFYAALHYIDHKIFPIQESSNPNNKTYPNFNKYYTEHRFSSQHNVRSDLVRTLLPNIFPYFEILKTAARESRYEDYNPKTQTIQMVIQSINQIRKTCK